MHRLAARRVQPFLRSCRSLHTEARPSAAASGRWSFAFGGLLVVGVVTYDIYALSTPARNDSTPLQRRPTPVQRTTVPSAQEERALPSVTVSESLPSTSEDSSMLPPDSDPTDSAKLEEDEKEEESEDDERLGPPVAAPYNPETGEFNWDCPCLGGLPNTICGEQFKGSFRCFVKSEAEPKGMDCVDAFNAMQQCFREHPEVYARELNIYDEVEKEKEDEDASAKIQNAEDEARTPDPAAEAHLEDAIVSPKSTSDTIIKAVDEKELAEKASAAVAAAPEKYTTPPKSEGTSSASSSETSS